MATAQVTEKKRVSKAVKRKAKKVLEPENADDDEEEPAEVKAAVKIAEAKIESEKKGTKETKKKTKANRLEEMAAKADMEPEEPRGVIYVGHIPDGFMEPQMRKFFGQFGRVTRLRISRSKKTARSKGYAFVEFEEESVAEIVAKTMNGYLLFDKTLVCTQMEKEKVHPMLFKGHKRRMINTSFSRRRKHTAAVNDRPTVEVNGEKLPQHTERQAGRRKKSDKKLNGLLKDLGVDYDISGADDQSRPKSPKAAAAKSPKLAAKASPKGPTPAAPAAAGAGKKKKRKVA